MAKYYKYYPTLEERNKAVMEALDETFKKIMASKEAADDFFKRAGIILEDAPETETDSKP
ncbi:hypothetical protein [Niastella sp. OAS944]|uniref:hypothetical protein n=1 Tax=Niastella sp. OAS944 TaxID=2664089 RepID=UPI003499EFCD|nr:hypothetical protein [Chitinophagaceae bacterium OAS944]